MASTGGKSKGVRVVTDAELASGAYEIQPGPVSLVTALAATVRGVTGGPALAVYPVTLAEAQRRGAIGGKSMPVTDVTGVRKTTSDSLAIPVYVVAGSLGGVVPVPPTPLPDTGTSNIICMDGTDNVTFTNTSNVDDMHDGDFTIEMWVQPNNSGSAAFLYKYDESVPASGWYFYANGTFDNFTFLMFADVAEYATVSSNLATYTEGAWHHVAVTFTQSTGVTALYVNGIDETLGVPTTASQPFLTDVGIPVIIGGNAGAGFQDFDGCYQWVNITNTIKYTDDFVPPPQGDKPSETDSIFNVPNQEGEGDEVTEVISGSTGSMSGGSTWFDGQPVQEVGASFMFAEFPVQGNDHKNIDETWGGDVL